MLDKNLNRINSVTALSFSTNHKNFPNLQNLSSGNSYSRFDDYQSSKEIKYTSYKDICNLLHYDYETWKPSYSKYDIYYKKSILDKSSYSNLLKNNTTQYTKTFSTNYKTLNNVVKKEDAKQDVPKDNDEIKEQNVKINDDQENKETVRKIAESNSEYMKKKHKKGEAFYWGKYGKISYPEQYFMNIFDKEFPSYEYNYHELTYYLDFAWTQSKKYIEIDGEQHKKQIEHDIKRDNKLKELGWSCIRVDWSKFIKLDESERQNFINDLKQFIIN